VRRVLVALLVALLAVAGVLAGLDVSGHLPGGLVADPTPSATPTRPLDPSPVAAGAVLSPEPTSTVTEPPPVMPDLPEAALRRVLASGDLGPDPGALVLDVAAGEPLLSVDPAAARTPASIAKLATGAAVLERLDPGSRLRTVVRAGATPGSLVLVGAGDASLLTRRSGADSYADRATMTDLADRTVAALRADGVSSVALSVDDSLFDGPAVSPDWPASYVGSGVVSPVSALSVDAGRVSAGSDVREADPAMAAGETLARLLSRGGIDVEGDVRRAPAPAAAPEVAAVESPTLAQLTELMLQTSDNDLAEALLRLVAVGNDRPGTFEDGRAVVAEVLGEVVGPGAGTDLVELLDGSGLARGSVVPPEVLARLLEVAAGDSSRGLWHLVTGLPVAGFTGTLSARFLSDVPLTSPAAGEVRAKTGTLTGVSTLAGTATADGRPVVLVVMGNEVTDTLAARAALDRFATLVASA
jgi:D-alanyl-D-alanine carboxypeptidase/D-alanyl-D-alanine-endopeptidase (penicillin-binding protein 4)